MGEEEEEAQCCVVELQVARKPIQGIIFFFFLSSATESLVRRRFETGRDSDQTDLLQDTFLFFLRGTFRCLRKRPQIPRRSKSTKLITERGVNEAGHNYRQP